MGAPIPRMRPLDQQPDLLDNVGRVTQIRGMEQNQQINQLAIQEQERQQKEQQATMQILGKYQGDIEKALPELAGTISPKAFMGIQDFLVKKKKELAEADDKILKGQEYRDSQFVALLDQGSSMTPEEYASQYPLLRAAAQKVHPELNLPEQAIPQEILPALKMGVISTAQMRQKEQDTRAAEAQKRDFEQKVKHETAMEKKDSSLSDSEIAFRAAQGDQIAMKALELRSKQIREGKPVNISGGAGTARADRSYQYQDTQLNKVSAQLDPLVQRMGRLQDTLDQNSPQADALIAPELLTVMAGGMGSGLRMNEAEISRIIGGRSKWETLKAHINQWSLDPATANSITPEQRTQIRKLVNEVQVRMNSKQKIINDAREALIATDDPTEHRRVVSKARQDIFGVDTARTVEGGGSSGKPSGDDPFKAFGGVKK